MNTGHIESTTLIESFSLLSKKEITFIFSGFQGEVSVSSLKGEMIMDDAVKFLNLGKFLGVI
jgi:hypothetical protein